MTKEEYNDEPVFYCGRCHSLNIKVIDEDVDYCEECGSSFIKIGHIDKWLNEEMDNGKNK